MNFDENFDLVSIRLYHDITLKKQMSLIEGSYIENKIIENRNNKSLTARKLGISREAIRKKLIIYNKMKEELLEIEKRKINMTTKFIEKELGRANFVNVYDVELNDNTNTFEVELNINEPHDSSDMTELLNLKNKIRDVVHRTYRIDFIIRFRV